MATASSALPTAAASPTAPNSPALFRAELLAVYLIRAFTHDLVNYLARVRRRSSGSRTRSRDSALSRHWQFDRPRHGPVPQ